MAIESAMTATSALQDRTELDGLPLYLPSEQAVLIGRVVDDESEMTGLAAYYIHWKGGLHIGTFHHDDHGFAPEFEIEADSRVMSHQATRFSEMEVAITLSSIGSALLDAYRYEETGQLPPQQAHVLALLEAGFDRQDIGDILNISVSTVDNHRRSATEKAVAAHEFVALHGQAGEAVERVGGETT